MWCHSRKHLPVLYDKMSVFYALKFLKFTTITFYLSAWRPNPILELPNYTTSSSPDALFNGIFTHVTRTTKISGTNMKIRRVLEYEIQEKMECSLNCWFKSNWVNSQPHKLLISRFILTTRNWMEGQLVDSQLITCLLAL